MSVKYTPMSHTSNVPNSDCFIKNSISRKNNYVNWQPLQKLYCTCIHQGQQEQQLIINISKLGHFNL